MIRLRTGRTIGVVMYSEQLKLNQQVQDIQIGYDTGSGDVQIGHNSSQTCL